MSLEEAESSEYVSKTVAQSAANRKPPPDSGNSTY
jgi:hypothetical protein